MREGNGGISCQRKSSYLRKLLKVDNEDNEVALFALEFSLHVHNP